MGSSSAARPLGHRLAPNGRAAEEQQIGAACRPAHRLHHALRQAKRAYELGALGDPGADTRIALVEHAVARKHVNDAARPREQQRAGQEVVVNHAREKGALALLLGVEDRQVAKGHVADHQVVGLGWQVDRLEAAPIGQPHVGVQVAGDLAGEGVELDTRDGGALAQVARHGGDCQTSAEGRLQHHQRAVERAQRRGQRRPQRGVERGRRVERGERGALKQLELGRACQLRHRTALGERALQQGGLAEGKIVCQRPQLVGAEVAGRTVRSLELAQQPQRRHVLGVAVGAVGKMKRAVVAVQREHMHRDLAGSMASQAACLRLRRVRRPCSSGGPMRGGLGRDSVIGTRPAAGRSAEAATRSASCVRTGWAPPQSATRSMRRNLARWRQGRFCGGLSGSLGSLGVLNASH
jgi:hypothetical protein